MPACKNIYIVDSSVAVEGEGFKWVFLLPTTFWQTKQTGQNYESITLHPVMDK
jgi:hypothetical protein